MELATSAATWIYGCGAHHPYAAETGCKALEAAGFGACVDIWLIWLKAPFNRQYTYGPNSTGEFWEGSKSFPSGHTATSFAFASVMAHRYPITLD
jgi:membrane-associated phospholipid phosphatase